MICVENDVVSTGFDAVRQVSIYVLRKNERQWTVEIPLSDVQSLMGNKQARRKLVESRLQGAMNGPSDDERSAPE